MWKVAFCLFVAIAFTNGSPVGQVEKGALCDVCRTLVTEIREYVTDHTKHAGIKERMLELCSGLHEGAEQEECLLAVHAFSPRMVEFFLHAMNPTEICSHMKICPAEVPVEKPMALPAKEGVEAGPLCEVCEFIVQTIDAYLKENKSEAAINATVYKVCDSLPGSLKDMCVGFAPQLVKILSNGADPKTACTDLRLCTSEFVGWKAMTCPVCHTALDAVMPKIAHEMCDYMKVCPVEEVKQSSAVVAPPVAASPGCEICEFVVQTIDAYLKENRSEAAINATVYKVCNSLPEALKDTCIGFAPSVVKIIAEGVDPKEACAKLHLCLEPELGGKEWHTITCDICHGAVETILPESFHALCITVDVCPVPKDEPKEKVEASPLCELCEFIVQTIDSYLKDNKSEAAINATVYKVCNSLPGTLKDTCLGFAPMLVKALSNGLDPKKACTAIKLCTSSTVQWDMLTCGFCQDIVHDVFEEEDFQARCVEMTMCSKTSPKKEKKEEPVKVKLAEPVVKPHPSSNRSH